MSRWRILALLVVAGAAGALAPRGRAVAAEDCSACHADVVHDSPIHGEIVPCTGCHANVAGYPHPEAPIGERRGAALCAQCHETAAGTAGVHAGLACLDCHGAAHRIAAPSNDACGTCHDAEAKELAGSVHAGAVTCQDCHGRVHDVLSSAERRAPTSPESQFRTCGRCHQTENDPIGRYLASSHARALLLKGLPSAPSCASCHGSHGVVGTRDARSPLSHRSAPETCGSCHRFVLDTWKAESSHGALWLAGRDEGPVCTTCHASHQAEHASERSVVVKTPEDCGGCHAKELATYRGSFHGKATSLGYLPGAVCSDCHRPHQSLPAADPRSSIHPSHLQETCGRCHAGAPASFASFSPHIDPSSAEASRPVHYVWLFMTALLLGVFGFFAVHDLLWLQRALVGLRRGEFGSRPVASGPHVRRFSPVQIRVHAVVMTTFLLLAATGLPIKYHHTEWARAVAAAFGGIAVMRVLHRIAAIATFGYAAFHVGHLIWRGLVHQEGGLLWGWKSMVPQPSDLRDLWNNLRYFVYLGPRPSFDHWGYWEKFDYFAVFWGVPIIGFSGLMLWFPEFFLRWLPGWTLNAAQIVHSDEALLAVGFIFIFHFFHTDLRPESFPLDPVIFTGVMPLERFREERPREYRRLVESGELESRLVDPPSPRTLRRARIAGAVAIGVGLLLVVAIFWAVLTH